MCPGFVYTRSAGSFCVNGPASQDTLGYALCVAMKICIFLSSYKERGVSCLLGKQKPSGCSLSLPWAHGPLEGSLSCFEQRVEGSLSCFEQRVEDILKHFCSVAHVASSAAKIPGLDPREPCKQLSALTLQMRKLRHGTWH